MAMIKKNKRKGLHLHRINPILFNGSPTDRQNITFITRLEHAELAVWWNRLVKDMKIQKNETTT
jgi:predicted metal-dependent HD superfamily phosphohydrolase